MAEDSTEALARSQLETLYRLGILERNSDDEEQSRSSSSGPHDAFLAALPPPSAIFRPISHYKPQQTSSLHSSASSSSSQSAQHCRRALRMWFRQWRSFLRNCREEARCQAVAETFMKLSIVTKWAAFLEQRRYWHEKQRLVESWKASRAISRWAHWKRRCRLVRELLKSGRRSFMGRIIQQRVWRRWVQFTKRSRYIRGVVAQRIRYRQHQVVRSVWIELRIHAFRIYQGSLALHRYLKNWREYLAIHERQRLMCMQYQQKANCGRKRELLQRWRAFAYASGRDRRLSWRVQFDLRRKRYFALWCEVARTVNYVEQLRSKIAFRELCQNFAAWKITVRAIQIGEQVRKIHAKRIRLIYFRAFTDQIRFNIHCNHVNLILRHRHQAAAINYLHGWAVERRRRRNMVDRIRKRRQMCLLRCVWLAGWLPVHRKRMAVKHSGTVLKARSLGAWKLFQNISTRRAYYLQEAQAEALSCKFRCKRTFEGWKTYYKLRLAHVQQLVKAQEQYRLRLLQRGVVVLWDAVYQSTESSLRAHHLRQNMRTSLRKRHLRAWHSLVQWRQTILKRLHHLQQRPDYQTSICNPSRRSWERWIRFVAVCRQRHHCDRYFRLRLKRQILLKWHQQAKVASRLQSFDSHRRRKTLEFLVNRWKSRVEKWKKVAIICQLAEKISEQKLSTRVIREWRCRSTYLRRVRLRGESIRRQLELKRQTTGFLEWQQQFIIHQWIFKCKQSHEHQRLRTCFTSWYTHSVQEKTFTRKLTYFQQVYGKYSTSSIVSRAWRRWQWTCRQSRYVTELQRKHQLRQAQRCWRHWKVFHTACTLFHAWHRVSQTLSGSSNRLGMRLRYFREARLYRIQKCMMDEWTGLVKRGRSLQERQSMWKHQVNRELEGAKWRSEQTARLQLRSWLQRWRRAHNRSNTLARNHLRCRVLSKVMLVWWKSTIHLKQEKVLVDAQRAMSKLSYYHPLYQVDATKAQRTDNQQKEKKKQSIRNAMDVPDARVESMRRMRRMLDPSEYASYSRFYQDRGREVLRNETYSEVTSARIASKHPASDLEFRRRLHSNQPFRADAIHRNGPGNCDCDVADDGDLEEETTCSTTIAKDISRCDGLTLGTNNNVPSRDVPIFQEQIHRDPSRCSPSKPHLNDLKRSANVLPLFDDEIASTGAGKFHLNDFQALKVGARGDKYTVCTRSNGTPAVFEPSLSLAPGSVHDIVDPRRKLRVAKTRKAKHNKQIKVVHSSNNEARPLSEILKLSDETEDDVPEYNEGHTDTQWNNANAWDVSILKEVVAFYVASVQTNADTKDELQSTRFRVCFRITRDLALLQNDFYINELQKVYDASFQDKFIEFCDVENSDKRDEQQKLELFLEHLVESHPAYREYLVNLSLRRPNVAPLSALNWLMQHHLRPLVMVQKRARARPIKSTTFWIWEAMPTEMDVALDKLLPVITKYMRVLGQFFLRQAVQSSSATDKPRDYRMSRTAFLSLLKQVRVFPQLFHRRELETAVCLSCCSCPETEQMNFPEFIEALVRCSCHLRWGDLDQGQGKTDNGDTFVVIKFVMLVFAMEGMGSMLTKRNEDVSAMLGFLGQQQKKKQAEKLSRFRRMLADNQRRTRATRTHQPRSVWSQVRLEFSRMNSPARSRISTRSHDTFDELTESWDGDSCHRVSTVFDAHTNQPFDLKVPSSPTTDEIHEEFVKNEDGDEASLSSPFSSEIPPSVVSTVTGSAQREEPACTTMCCEEKENIGSRQDLNSVASIPSATDAESSKQVHQVSTLSQSTGFVESMAKDNFLRDIMDSIGDVELLLSQPRFTGSNYLTLDRKPPRKTFPSDSTRADSMVCVPSLSELAEESLLHDWQHQITNTCSSSTATASDTQIRDPMLNYLTDIERFTESTDTASLVAIAGMEGLPFTQDPVTQDHNLDPDTWASQELRPTEKVAVSSSPQTSTHESDVHENTIK